mmetsp:Transcript_6677/g.13230  ORF Transcript_6677/g.13230 Transcript_6677/m.13230 type:complete len:211 (-) Transcript_6677:131-763(-)
MQRPRQGIRRHPPERLCVCHGPRNPGSGRTPGHCLRLHRIHFWKHADQCRKAIRRLHLPENDGRQGLLRTNGIHAGTRHFVPGRGRDLVQEPTGVVPRRQQPTLPLRHVLSGRREPRPLLRSLLGQHRVLLRPKQPPDAVLFQRPADGRRSHSQHQFPPDCTHCPAQRAHQPLRAPGQDLGSQQARVPRWLYLSQPQGQRVHEGTHGNQQ